MNKFAALYREMLEQSHKELQTTIEEMEKRIGGVDTESKRSNNESEEEEEKRSSSSSSPSHPPNSFSHFIFNLILSVKLL